MIQYFSLIGTNFLQIWKGEETKTPADFNCDVEMVETRPTDNSISQSDGNWV